MADLHYFPKHATASVPAASPDLVHSRLPVIFRVTTVERHPLPQGGVRNAASLFNEAASLQVDWLSRQVDPRIQSDCLVSIGWQGNSVSVGGHVRIARLVPLLRPMADTDLFRTVPTRWVRDRELLRRVSELWQGLPYGFRHLFNAVFWDGQRFHRYLVGPSSLENHHSERNGNFRHSVDVVEQCLRLACDQPLVSRPVLIMAGLLHDAGKAYEYSFDHRRQRFEMAPEAMLVGHRDRLQHWLAAALTVCRDEVPNQQFLALVHALTATYGAPPHLGLREPLSLEAILLSMADRASGRSELIGRLAPTDGGFGKFHRHLRGRPFVAQPWG